jgi:type III secretory pathway component EscS
MKYTLLQLGTKINRQTIQFILTLIALALLVLGIGAPMDGGGGNC